MACFDCLSGFCFTYQSLQLSPGVLLFTLMLSPVPLGESERCRAELPAGAQPWQSLSNAACAEPQTNPPFWPFRQHFSCHKTANQALLLGVYKSMMVPESGSTSLNLDLGLNCFLPHLPAQTGSCGSQKRCFLTCRHEESSVSSWTSLWEVHTLGQLSWSSFRLTSH